MGVSKSVSVGLSVVMSLGTGVGVLVSKNRM